MKNKLLIFFCTVFLLVLLSSCTTNNTVVYADNVTYECPILTVYDYRYDYYCSGGVTHISISAEPYINKSFKVNCS